MADTTKEAEMRAAIGAAFRSARQSRALSQATVAKMARTKQSTISEVERGAENVKVDTMLRIAVALDMTMRVCFTPDEHRVDLEGVA